MCRPRFAIRRVAIALWIVFLGTALIVSARAAHRHADEVLEYPFGCDPFGYLQMARQIRHSQGCPLSIDFHLEYPQTWLLIAALKESDIPVSRWHELVAPHAHHYFPVADAVGPQYPPGTALILAAFPEGRAIRGLNDVEIGALLVVGLFLIAFAAWKRFWLAAGFIAVATVAGLDIVANIGYASFSINAMLLPVLLAVLCASAASWCSNRWVRFAFAIAAGANLGLGVLVRLPIVLLAPGLFILLLPHAISDVRPRRLVGQASIWFLFALALVGLAPLLVHQHNVAGDWHLPTYATNDTAPPSLRYVPENGWFYLTQPDLQGLASWQVLLVAIGWLIVARAFPSTNKGRFIAAALALWGAPAAYFLTHRVATPYYAIPSMFATLWLVALELLRLEAVAAASNHPLKGRTRSVVAAIAGTILVVQSVQLYRTAPSEISTDVLSPNMPAEFQQGKPWIWADIVSGTIVYYADAPTFKISFCDSETRQRVFAIALASGEPQYLVVDCPSMQEIAVEIQTLGGKLERRGEVAAYPYYRIHWPANPAGPRP
jgi:hypothetical protein